MDSKHHVLIFVSNVFTSSKRFHFQDQTWQARPRTGNWPPNQVFVKPVSKHEVEAAAQVHRISQAGGLSIALSPLARQGSRMSHCASAPTLSLRSKDGRPSTSSPLPPLNSEGSARGHRARTPGPMSFTASPVASQSRRVLGPPVPEAATRYSSQHDHTLEATRHMVTSSDLVALNLDLLPSLSQTIPVQQSPSFASPEERFGPSERHEPHRKQAYNIGDRVGC
jgi:hypothetical protein